MAGNSESRFLVARTPSRSAKIVAVRDRLPNARGGHRDRAGDARRRDPLDDLRERGRGRDAAEVAARAAAVKPEDPYTIIYTSGTTGPPKGCVLTHGNYRSVVTMCEEESILHEGDVVYLYLPLAHSFALLIQLIAIDLGAHARLLGRRPEADRRRADGGQAALPAVGPAHLREDLHAGHVAAATRRRSAAPRSSG